MDVLPETANRAVSSVVEHYNDTVGVTGSNPVPPTIFWTYNIQNPEGRFYVGHTDNLDQPVEFHNTWQSHYTARKGPWNMVYSEQFGSRSAAMKRETEIKHWKSAVKIRELIAAMEPMNATA